MTKLELKNLKNWFEAYADSYISQAEEPAPYRLKKQHTFRVCREIMSLGRALKLTEDNLLLAEAAACLHDVGRFRQMREYGTFLDDLSEDHAQLGLQVIEEKKLLDGSSAAESRWLKAAVGFHNAAGLPADQDETALFLIKLLRDADKLDIWSVVIDSYQNKDSAVQAVVHLGLVDDGQYSPEALRAINEKRLVNRSDVARLNDFKLMQISWVFDLNFAPSVASVQKRGYIPAIMDTLPPSVELTEAFQKVDDYMKSFMVNRG